MIKISEKTKMTKQELKEWDELYEYVRSEIFKYPKELKLPSYIVLRLKGLKEGKFCANTKQENNADYSFKIILYTFKICKMNILNYIERNNGSFKDEKHKFNGIMIIIENNINDVFLRLKNIKTSQEKVEKLELNNHDYKGATYKKREKKVNKILDELW